MSLANARWLVFQNHENDDQWINQMIRTHLTIKIDLVSKKTTTSGPHARNSETETIIGNKFGLTVPSDMPFADQDTAESNLCCSHHRAAFSLALSIMKTVSNQLLTLSDELVEIRLLESTGNPEHTWNINSKELMDKDIVVVHELIYDDQKYLPFEFPGPAMIGKASLIREVFSVAEDRHVSLAAAFCQLRSFGQCQKTDDGSALYKTLVCLLGINLVINTIGRTPRSIRKGKVSYAEFLMWHSVMSTKLHVQKFDELSLKVALDPSGSVRPPKPRLAYLRHLFA